MGVETGEVDGAADEEAAGEGVAGMEGEGAAEEDGDGAAGAASATTCRTPFV